MLLNSPMMTSERDPALQSRMLLALNLEFESSPIEGCWGTLICDVWGDLVLNRCSMQCAWSLMLPSLQSSPELFPISSTHWAVILILSFLSCWICAAPSSCACRLRSWSSYMDREQQLLCSALSPCNGPGGFSAPSSASWDGEGMAVGAGIPCCLSAGV